jgi:hypothetical protein
MVLLVYPAVEAFARANLTGSNLTGVTVTFT